MEIRLMHHSKRGAALFSAALAALCATAGHAQAGSSPSPAAAAAAAPTPVYLESNASGATVPAYLQADADAPARRPLMQLLDNAGIADGLDDARIRLFGHVEGSWTHNFDDPQNDLNIGRLFDIEHDDPTLNQVSLNVERAVVPSADEFDLGFRVEVIYGGDARFTHANGLGDGEGFFDGPDEQFDLLQAYVDVNAPVGDGLRIRAGKFTYFKVIDPTAAPLYSRSFSYVGAVPFTLTGVYGTYAVSDTLTVDLGLSRGWDQALEDNNNDAISAFGAFRVVLGDDTNLAVKWMTGPELDDNSGAFRTVVDATLSHKLSDQLTLIGNGIVGHQSGGADDDIFAHAWWYGASAYAIYDINEYLQFNGRLEWFRDEDGATVTGGPTANLYSATAGVTITPFPTDDLLRGLKIRPEVRYDYASTDVFDLDETGAATDDQQFTGAIEAYFAF
jgi:hypothetical protein